MKQSPFGILLQNPDRLLFPLYAGATLRKTALIDSFLPDYDLRFLQLGFIRQIFRSYMTK